MLDHIHSSRSSFKKAHLLELAVLLELPQLFRTVNRLNLPAEDALAIALRRLAYPSRMGDLELFFGRSKSSLSRIFNAVIYHIYDRFNHLLRWDRNRLTVDVLDRFCMAVNAKGVPPNNCFGFIDGTIRQISRPKMNQRLFFNGHRRKHSVKYQSVTTPDGLIVHLFGPVEGRRHDIALLTLSLLDADMLTYPRNTNGDRYCIYGDLAYGLKSWLLSPYKGAQLTAGQQEFNRVMSGVRESVEWGFQRIVTYWAFVDYHKNQKLLLQPIGIYYPVCAILSNLLACYNSSQTAAFFQMQPPSPREYLHSQ